MGSPLPPLAALALLFPVGAPIGRALALARALLVPGGRIALCGALRIEAPWWPGSTRWSTLNTALDKAEQAVAALAEPLRAAGYAVDTAVLCGEEDRPEPGLPVIADGFDEDESLRWAELLLEAGGPLIWPGDRVPEGPRTVLVPQRIGPLRLPPPPDELLQRSDLRLILLGEASPAEGGEERLAPDALPAGPGGLLRLQAFVEARGVGLILVPLPALGPAGRHVLARLLAAWRGALPAPLWLAEGEAPLPAPLGELEASDLLLTGGLVWGWLNRAGVFGGPVEAGAAQLSRRGVALGALAVRQGLLLGPLQAEPGALTLSLDGERCPANLLSAAGRIGLFDAANPASAARAMAADPARQWWGVRLHPEQALAELRANLRRHGLEALLDAEALLRDGPAEDRPEGFAHLRLARLARWLRARGIGVDVVLAEGEGRGFWMASPAFLPEDPALFRARVEAAWRAPGDALLERADAAPDRASRLHVELDNRGARERQLDLVRSARERIHLRTCLYHDDRHGGALTAALAEAARRGVEVRVMADSLYSLHGSLGQSNPALARLSGLAEVRVWSPVQSARVLDLKRRDHCKQLIVDGRVGVIGGRNVGDPYLTGWTEVPVSAKTPYRDVPWLDASFEVEGPVVRAIDASFRRAWRASGGGDFALREAAGAGDIPVRFVEHYGLEDTHTLDAYEALIDGARARVTLVNTFPLHDELAHRLLDALNRGVKVRFLVGNVRPLYGDREPFPGGVWRELATQVIHGRLDALVTAGAEAFEFTLRGVEGWDPAIGPVWPHVHAKLLCVDGERCTAGSANLDLTSGYWENECLLVVEDAAVTRGLEERLDAILAASARIDPEDPAWALRAGRRAWLARSWPDLLA